MACSSGDQSKYTPEPQKERDNSVVMYEQKFGELLLQEMVHGDDIAPLHDRHHLDSVYLMPVMGSQGFGSLEPHLCVLFGLTKVVTIVSDANRAVEVQ